MACSDSCQCEKCMVQPGENTVNNTVRREVRNGGSFITGNPGNKGGTGRPKSEVRAALAQAFDKRIPLLESIADNESLPESERMKAMEMMGKYGGLQQVDQTSGDERINSIKIDFGNMSVEERQQMLDNLP